MQERAADWAQQQRRLQATWEQRMAEQQHAHEKQLTQALLERLWPSRLTFLNHYLVI